MQLIGKAAPTERAHAGRVGETEVVGPFGGIAAEVGESIEVPVSPRGLILDFLDAVEEADG